MAGAERIASDSISVISHKYNYNKRRDDGYKAPKFYGKIRANNDDTRPKKNYEDKEKEKEKNEEEEEEENI